MTTPKLIVLRIIMTTLGRSAWFAESFKKFMVWYTISRRGEQKYVASSRYFSLDLLEKPVPQTFKNLQK